MQTQTQLAFNHRGKVNQIKAGLVIFMANGLLLAKTVAVDINFAVFWILGLLFGFILQRSRFCMAGVFRDVYLFKNSFLAQALTIYLIISTVLFGALYYTAPLTALSLTGKIEPVTFYTMLGGMMFGIGMVISGGCVSGVVTRMGEGQVMQWLTFIGIAVGSLLGAGHYELYNGTRYQAQVFLPELVGFWPAITLQLAILIMIYFILSKNNNKNILTFTITKAKTAEPKSFSAYYHRLFIKPWSYLTGVVSLAILNTLAFAWERPLGITSGITHLAGGVLDLAGVNISNWNYFSRYDFETGIFLNYVFVPMILAIVIGSLLSSLLAGEFRVRKVRKKKFVLAALIGGMLMGYGARLAHGCPVGSLLGGIPSLSLHGWVFSILLIPGVIIGAKILTTFLAND